MPDSMNAMSATHHDDLVRRPGAAARLLRHARSKAKVTQRELAGRAGVPQATVGRIETGAVQPRFETLLLLLNAAGFELELRARRGDGVDRTLIREMLALSPGDRVAIGVDESRRVDELLGALDS